MPISKFTLMVLVSCERDARGLYTVTHRSFGKESGVSCASSGQSWGVSQEELPDLLSCSLSSDVSDAAVSLYFVADSETMKALEDAPEFQRLLKNSQPNAVFTTLISPPGMHEDYVKQMWSNISTLERVAPILEKLEQSLVKLQKEFPCPSNAVLKHVSKEYTLEDCKNNIGNLLSTFLTRVIVPAKTLILQNKFDKAQCDKFKDACSYLLEQDPMTQKLKNTANKLEPDTVLYDLHYAAISFVRAFFRIFDVLVTLFSKHTINETPGRNPVFKLPEPPLSRRIAGLMKEFKHATRDLEDICHHAQQKNNRALA